MQKRKTFSQKIDAISENIIYLLSIDARKSTTEIARELNCSRKRVETRIEKLFEKRIIKPLLVINGEQEIKTTVLIKLSRFNTEIEDKIKKLQKSIKVKETLGPYDLSILIISKNIKEIEEEIRRIDRLFQNAILQMEIITHKFEDTLGYKSFCHEPLLKRKYNLLKKSTRNNLSKEEKLTINFLRTDPLMKYSTLIQKTKLPYSRLRSSISSLKKDFVRFTIDPDYEKLNLEFHNMLVKINPAKKKEFIANIIKNKRIHWVKEGVGRWDYILSVCSRDIREFIDITREFRTENKKIITDFSTLISKVNTMRKY